MCSSLGENPLFCERLNPQRVEDDSTHFALESEEYICVPVLLKKIYIWHILYQHLLVQQINMLLWMCNGCEEIQEDFNILIFYVHFSVHILGSALEGSCRISVLHQVAESVR